MVRAYLSELFAPGLPLRGSPDSRAISLGAVPAAPSSLSFDKPQPWLPVARIRFKCDAAVERALLWIVNLSTGEGFLVFSLTGPAVAPERMNLRAYNAFERFERS